MPKKGNLKSALAKHNAAQQLKAKQKAADEARERKHASVIASQSGSKDSSSNKKNKKARTAGAGLDGDVAGDLKEDIAAGGVPRGAKGKQRLIEPFERDDTILLVGEGEAFASSLSADSLADLRHFF